MPNTPPPSRPRARTKAVVGLVAIVVALAATSCLSPGQASVRDSLNHDRTQHRLAALPDHPTLNAKAQAWAEQLAKANSLRHSDVRSGAPGCWTALAENVGYGPDPTSVERAYMESDGHRANILDRRWDYVGVGHATRGDRTFTVQVFMEGCR